MRPPAMCSEKPSNHKTKRTTTTVQIKLTMQSLPGMISRYLIAAISYYRRVRLVSTWVVVARTRAVSGLSAARLAGMSTTGWGRKPEAVADEQPELAAERHRLAEIREEGTPRGLPATHPPIL
jgi:hypothetical protein